MNMQAFISSLMELATAVGGKIVLALVVLIVGSAVIKKSVKLVSKSKALNKVEGTVRSFVVSFVKIGLYVVLVISIIGILGVPMASVVAVLASAGVAVGLALQGALSNLAGGIMLMIFRPFRQGDYIEAAGVDGVVQEVTLFYTVLLSLDNKRITVPNGNLMNANVVDYSAEPLRRVDLEFSCAKSEKPAEIQQCILDVVAGSSLALRDPAPFARVSGGTNEAMTFTVRVWCKTADYWDLYFDLNQSIVEAFAAKGVQAPALRVVYEQQG
jgi:small conductance mechanosensitive channel